MKFNGGREMEFPVVSNTLFLLENILLHLNSIKNLIVILFDLVCTHELCSGLMYNVYRHLLGLSNKK